MATCPLPRKTGPQPEELKPRNSAARPRRRRSTLRRNTARSAGCCRTARSRPDRGSAASRASTPPTPWRRDLPTPGGATLAGLGTLLATIPHPVKSGQAGGTGPKPPQKPAPNQATNAAEPVVPISPEASQRQSDPRATAREASASYRPASAIAERSDPRILRSQSAKSAPD